MRKDFNHLCHLKISYFVRHSVQQVVKFWWSYAILSGLKYVLHQEILEILLDTFSSNQYNK